ncbi:MULTISPECIES: TM2 domain-containing protein [unclassified Roseofilum]|uniref:TM2 domain-containing protein n=1 Tax=unclassified Roseofilum TaxID=2620099 RepID=UPI000E947F42|nr:MULTISPECIES: NINE protein [unclassified Roseofilum]HBQ98072.1 hypothetical protein [Cyanobacteria bacterium UBA11691]MBP0009863.1 NINE protein [Roseofilum sp. Belize Diploria]MBP0014726.1 NINE protein [Roseofilum sp. SID3]MBP0025254.1 NINE protein [Roseofilum sp. SID2]MBP0034307.1 NINE protein [Roseofilum sp. Belize BBD 4]
MNKVSTTYLLWLLGMFGANGIHRLYNGKIATGILWCCTFGLFGIGQFIDLIFIPGMVDEYNLKYRLKHGLSPTGIPLSPQTIPCEVVEVTEKQAPEPTKVKLVKAAAARGGEISVTQAVVDTGLDFDEVESLLLEMLKKGYVTVDNHPQTGVVLYRFEEL